MKAETSSQSAKSMNFDPIEKFKRLKCEIDKLETDLEYYKNKVKQNKIAQYIQ